MRRLFNRAFERGSRKVTIGYVYLIGHFLLAFYILTFRPGEGLSGLAALAGALAAGLGTVIAGHVWEEHRNGSPPPPPSETP